MSGLKPGQACTSMPLPQSPTSQEPTSQATSLGQGWLSCAMSVGSAWRALNLLTPRLQEQLCQALLACGSDPLRQGSSSSHDTIEQDLRGGGGRAEHRHESVTYSLKGGTQESRAH